MRERMIIAIDYDHTYTNDPQLWDEFSRNALSRNHTVYCVSSRDERTMDDAKNTIGKVIGPANCFGTNLHPKREFMIKNHNIYIDVWVDDTPDTIVESHWYGHQ